MACDHSDLIAGVASLAGSTFEGVLSGAFVVLFVCCFMPFFCCLCAVLCRLLFKSDEFDRGLRPLWPARVQLLTDGSSQCA